MDSRTTHLIALLVAAAIVAVAAPIAQGGNPNHRVPVPDPVRAAYTAAWQAYRGLPGGPPVGPRSGYPQLETGQGFSFAAPIGWARATPPAANGSGGFDWSDWAVGIGTGLGLALLLGGGLLIGRQLRHRGIQTA